MEQKNYIQCQLQKDDTLHIKWIEEKYAIKGNVLEMKVNEHWQSGWTIIRCGGKVSEHTLFKVIHMNYTEVK